MKIFSFLQSGPPLRIFYAKKKKNVKGASFLLAVGPAWQAVHKLDCKPHCLPRPMSSCSGKPPHPYISPLLSPSLRGKPEVRYVLSWLLSPLISLKKVKANMSWIQLSHPRKGEMEDDALHWKGRTRRSGYNFSTLEREGGKPRGRLQ